MTKKKRIVNCRFCKEEMWFRNYRVHLRRAHPEAGELSNTHDVITGVGTVELEAEGVPPDERADIVPAATGDLSDTHDFITGVRAVDLDTAEGVPRYERADIVPTATRDRGDNQDVIGVETYELDSPDGATAIDPRDHKEDIRIRSQNLLDSLRRGRKDCYICCQGLHDKMGVGCHSKKYRL